MNKFYLMVAMATTVIFIQLGCQGFSEDTSSPTFTRIEILKRIIENPSSRIAIWNSVSLENQYSIWKEKIEQVSSQQLKPEWIPLFQELRSNFSFQLYTQANGDLNNSAYLSNWIDRFSVLATEDERYFTIGSLYDYDANSNTILNKFIQQSKDSDVLSGSSQKIENRSQPGAGHDCDCKWTNCGSDEYCCKPSGTTGCNPTRNGCGFLWQQGCESFCLSGIIYNCDDF